MEIKIKWIKRKQMTHENTYRDDNYVLCLGIDVSVKTRITKKIGWKKSPCS